MTLMLYAWAALHYALGARGLRRVLDPDLRRL